MSMAKRQIAALSYSIVSHVELPEMRELIVDWMTRHLIDKNLVR